MRVPPPLFGTDTTPLAPFVAAGLLGDAECLLADAVACSAGDGRPELLLAVGFALRAVRQGHLCIDLETVASEAAVDAGGSPAFEALCWPDPDRWLAAVRSSPATAPAGPSDERLAPLVVEGSRVYLDRYFSYEVAIADALVARALAPDRATPGLGVLLDGTFGPGERLQRRAVESALAGRLALIAGGPGTGKTWTVARLLAVARSIGRDGAPLRVALAAPTGKAASRMAEAVREAGGELQAGEPGAPDEGGAVTIHRLLGGDRAGRFAYGRDRPLPFDLVVVDEASMVSASLMAHLLEALGPEASLVLVGDPFQLASVDAGAIWGEIVLPALGSGAGGALGGRLVVLERSRRFSAGSVIAQLADRVQRGDAAGTLELLAGGGPELTWIRPGERTRLDALSAELAGRACEVVRCARAGDVSGALARSSASKVLAATRHGELGSRSWQAGIERGLAARLPAPPPAGWYAGRPVIVTANDYPNRLYNGETGIVVRAERGPEVAFSTDGGLRYVRAGQLGAIETWWAMTVHKSQGSEFDEVVVVLPEPGSPVLTRELLYTALTRARRRVVLVASEGTVATAVAARARRRSGLAARLGAVGA